MRCNGKAYAEQMVERCSEMILDALKKKDIEDIDMYRLGYNKGIEDGVNKTFKKLRERLGQYVEHDSILIDINTLEDEIMYIAEEIGQEV